MLHFDSDYMEGAHPRIIEALAADEGNQHVGYGTDEICDEAKNRIREACGHPDAEVWFLVGGTQTNKTVISSMLRPYEGVIAAETGHIALHEAGAVEAGGHKVITIPSHEGKIDADELAGYLDALAADDNREHMVHPGMVYISHPTEMGTLYTKDELERISGVCHKAGIPLFLDGARLGYGLASPGTDVTMRTVADTCDVFYVGGTKVGALFGEAVVVTKPGLIPGFFTQIKLNGALLAKGWLLGLQFNTLFTDDLYMDISRNAIEQARRLKQAFVDKGYRLAFDSPTNQQFIVVDDETRERLARGTTFSFWEQVDSTHTIIRFVTSWATKAEDVDALIALL